MATAYGMPIWYELTTPDVAAAKAFYGPVVGWGFNAFATPGDGPPYTIVEAEGTGIGGMMTPPQGGPGGWYGYFHVADVDAAAATNEAAGGKTFMPPVDMPGVGRMAFVNDPQGVGLYLMTPDPTMGSGESTAFSRTLPGRVAWNELVTTDHKAALGTYGDLLGLTSPRVMDMGPMGDYTFIAAGGTEIGATMDRAQPEQPTRWSFYFRVPDVDAAVDKVKQGGGQVLMGPHDVPGGERIILCVDPQGAGFGLVSGAGE